MKLNKGLLGAGIAAAIFAVVPTAANATIVTVFDGIDPGVISFNATVTGTGATPTADVVTVGFNGTTYNGVGYTVTKPTGSVFDSSVYNVTGSRTLSGGAFNINPAGPNPGHGGNPADSLNSGIQFNFATAVNAIGFEVGDWGTCCQISNLYISFDGGAPILVGSSTGANNVFLTDGGAGVFVAAFDDSNDFQTVNFWGDGYGEFLVAGGTIRSALVGRATLGVPEPITLTLFGAGLVGAAALRRRKIKKA